MNRSGLSDEGDMDDPLEYGRWRGAVRSAMRGKRGQAFLRELLAALDAMPEKKLIEGELQKPTGEVCAIGCLAKARGIDMADFDVYDYERIAKTLAVNEKLVQETEWVNDEWGSNDAKRFEAVREWCVENIREAPTGDSER